MVPWLVGVIRRVQPKVVITFEPNGGYGHPDHIAIHRHTVADPGQYPKQGRPALLHGDPRFFFLRMRDEMAALGMDTSQFDRFEEGGARGWPDDQVTVMLRLHTRLSVVQKGKQNAPFDFSDNLYLVRGESSPLLSRCPNFAVSV